MAKHHGRRLSRRGFLKHATLVSFGALAADALVPAVAQEAYEAAAQPANKLFLPLIRTDAAAPPAPTPPQGSTPAPTAQPGTTPTSQPGTTPTPTSQPGSTPTPTPTSQPGITSTPTPTPVAPPISLHGLTLRGLDLVTRDRSAEGRFGRMFKDLPAFTPGEDLLTNLGGHMEELHRSPPANPDDNDRANDNPNPALTTGFTFLGQFIDHDITFDRTPLALQQADPDATTNFRTPRYDLDALYGQGPVADPQFYDPQDRDKFLIVVNQHGVADVPRRGDGRAIISDPRNDQHLIIVQLHLALMQFHNQLVDLLRLQGVVPISVFDLARQLTRWHYQWVVIHDFLPRIVGQEIMNQVYNELLGLVPVITLAYYRPQNLLDRPFIPVEFSAAAYRFGHSITRPRYTMSATVGKVPLFVEALDATTWDNALNGSRPIPTRLKLEWSRFFNDPASTTITAKPVRKIDTRLALPLFVLPSSVVAPPDTRNLLAVRNLLRQRTLELPSGQQVAQRMGAPVLSNTELGLPAIDPRWSQAPWTEAPLWYYILKEAEILRGTRQLGPVGGRIVAEVLVGLLQRDLNSYLLPNPAWKPTPPIAPAIGRFTMVDLLKFARAWT